MIADDEHREIGAALALLAVGDPAAADDAQAALEWIAGDPSSTSITAGECVVIETAARIAAGQIGYLLWHALGIDPWAACLDAAIGRPAPLAPSRAGYATVRFLTAPHAGRLTAITGLPATGPCVPAVRVRARPGDIVGPATDNTARLGSIIVTGSSQAAADDHAERVMDRIRVFVDAAGGPGR